MSFSSPPRHLVLLALALPLIAACGGGGGGGSDGGSSGPGGGGSAAAQVITYATTVADGTYSQVDLVDGGRPDDDPAATNLDTARRQFFKTLSKIKKNNTSGKWEAFGTDLDGDLRDLTDAVGNPLNPDGIPETGFDTYTLGLNPQGGARIIAANNLYDLLQSTTGQPNLAVLQPGFPGYTGGDIGKPGQTSFDPTPDGINDGGPGLFSNVSGAVYPTLPVLPNAMGSPAARGPSTTDEHQFIQIEFPYKLDLESLFSSDAFNSYLSSNVTVELRAILIQGANAVDQTALHTHISGVGIIGGVDALGNAVGITAIPDPLLGTNSVGGRATVSAGLSNLPSGALANLTKRNVFTFIAHEQVTLFAAGNPATGRIAGGALILPDPTELTGLGGRVFGGTPAVPGAVNDFGTSGTADAAAVGFVSLRIAQLRKTGGQVVEWPYFHTFPMSQTDIGTDPRAVQGTNGVLTFNRGAAIEIDASTLPAIDVLDPAQDVIGGLAAYNPSPSGDHPDNGGNVVSTRARFLVEFDREVIPNSVGFSRRFTLHSTQSRGVVFPFGGNVRPVTSPASFFGQDLVGSPLAPSIYLAVNQAAGFDRSPSSNTRDIKLKVNSPVSHAAITFDGSGPGSPGNFFFDDGLTKILPRDMNGLNPTAHNTLAQIPRGVVPCDIYPINQNNLQAYVVEPLVELPPGAVVTLGVAVAGLGYSNAAASLSTSNHGNGTRSGTMFTSFQGLTPAGLGDKAMPSKQVVLPDQAVVKVNASAMDLQGNLFYGGTAVAIDQLLNQDAGDDATTGGFNLARTFQVGQDNEKRYVNAPVAPQALYVGFSAGLGVLDLSGTGLTTNAPGGAGGNVGFENHLLVSRFLPQGMLGTPGSDFNWNAAGSLAAAEHMRSFGLLSPYTAGIGKTSQGASLQSDRAIGGAIAVGLLTPVPGINEGSSGYETLVRDSFGNSLLTRDDVRLVRDIVVGEFLDTVFFDTENPWAVAANHRTHNTPVAGFSGGGSISSNTIADPPLPNPPPLRFPAGLPHLSVVFDQDDLSKPPRTVEGTEVLAADGFLSFNDGTLSTIAPRIVNTLVQLNPTSNTTNGGTTDTPPLPLAGYLTPFGARTGMSSPTKFVQTGPMPKSITAGAWVLTDPVVNGVTPNTGDASGLLPPIYQSRQQIGNFLFVTDGVNNELHAINSNSVEVIRSLGLPDPYGLGMTSDLNTLFVSNEADNSVSVVDADPTSPAFMTELRRLPVGSGPRAVAVAPDNEDAFVLNTAGNTISIIDVPSLTVRKTLTSQTIDRPFDICLGMRESIAFNMPAFGGGAYHGFVSNLGDNNVLIYESGPDGPAGVGLDNIITTVRPNEGSSVESGTPWQEMIQPRGIVYDPQHPLDSANNTIGCYVAHTDQLGRAAATRIGFTFEQGTTQIFKVTAQYVSQFPGKGLDVALPDYNRERFEESSFATFYNLFNAGAKAKVLTSGFVIPENSKYPLADNGQPATTNGPRWEPDRLYLSSSDAGQGRIEAFNIATNAHLKVISTPKPPSILTSYFAQ